MQNLPKKNDMPLAAILAAARKYPIWQEASIYLDGLQTLRLRKTSFLNQEQTFRP